MAESGVETSRVSDGDRDSKSLWEAIGDLDRKVAGAALSVHRMVQEFKQGLESLKQDRHRTGRDLTRTPVEKMEGPYLHRKFQKEHTNRFKSTSPVKDSGTEIDIPEWNEGRTRPSLIDRYIRDKGCGGFRLKMEIPVFDEIECWFHEYMEKEACFGGFYQANNAAESVVVRFNRNLPVFDGFWDIENLLIWIDAIDDFFDEIKPPEHLKCKIVWYKMKGAAYYWWKQIQDDRNGHGKEEIISWPRMRKLLISRFTPSSCSIKVSSEPYMSKTDKKEDTKTETVVEHETNRKYVLHDADSLQIPVQEIKFELSIGEGADVGESKSKPECRNLEILSNPGTITLHSHEHANDVGIYNYGLARNSYLTGSWMHTYVGLEHDFQLAPFAGKSRISWCHLNDSDGATNEAFFTIESTTGSSWGSLGLKRKSWDEIFTHSLNLELGTKRVFYRLLYLSKKHTIQFLLLPSMLETYSDEDVFLFDPGGDVHLLGNMERIVDGLWNELDMLSYYRFTVQLCNHFSSRLTDMRKQRGCSYESREAVCPLVYTPADFADLPEFRDPRNVSLERHETVKCCAKEYFYTPTLIPPSTDTQLTMQEKGISYWAETCIHFYNLVLVRERLALKGFEHVFMINRFVFTSVDGYLTPFIKRYSSRYLSKIEACWMRGAHFMLLQHLPKVHRPMTFSFDPGGSSCSTESWGIIHLIIYAESFVLNDTIEDKKFEKKGDMGESATESILLDIILANEIRSHLHDRCVYGVLVVRLTFERMKMTQENKRSLVSTLVVRVGNQRCGAAWIGNNIISNNELDSEIEKLSMMSLLVELVRPYLTQVSPRTEPVWASLRLERPTKRCEFVKVGTLRNGTTQFWKLHSRLENCIKFVFDPGGSTHLLDTWGFKNYIFSCSNMIDGSTEGYSNSQVKATLTTYGDDIDPLTVVSNASHVSQMNLDIFVALCKTIAFICQKEKPGNIFELLSAIYTASIPKELISTVRSLAFKCTAAFILILSLTNVSIETTLDVVNSLSQLVGQKVELVLVWIYAMVIALEVGFINYGRDEHSRFKTNVVVFTSLLGIWNVNGSVKKVSRLFHKKLQMFNSRSWISNTPTCTRVNGYRKKTLKLFFTLVNGLDPPNDEMKTEEHVKINVEFYEFARGRALFWGAMEMM